MVESSSTSGSPTTGKRALSGGRGAGRGSLGGDLLALGHPVYPVGPKISVRARERYLAAPKKDDRFDAFVLADTLRHGSDAGGPSCP